MSKSIKYMGVSDKYTKNGTPKGFTSITPFITVNCLVSHTIITILRVKQHMLRRALY